jgi:hypothetical protein
MHYCRWTAKPLVFVFVETWSLALEGNVILERVALVCWDMCLVSENYHGHTNYLGNVLSLNGSQLLMKRSRNLAARVQGIGHHFLGGHLLLDIAL